MLSYLAIHRFEHEFDFLTLVVAATAQNVDNGLLVCAW